MPIIDPKTDLRSLSYKEFGTIGDPLVVKDIPGVNQDGPSKGVLKQVTARTDDALRMTRLLVLQGGKRNPAGNKFTANLALLNQQETISKVRKLEKGNFKGGLKNVGKSFLGGAADTGKTLASILAQVPVAGTGTHFVNGGKVGKEYLKGGGGNAIGNLLRGLVGADGLQGHERVLAGRPININKQSVDDSTDYESLKQKYENKIKDSNQIEPQRDSNLRQPFNLIRNTDLKSSDTTGETSSTDTLRTRLMMQGDPGKHPGGSILASDLINISSIVLETPEYRDKDIIPFEIQVFNPSAGNSRPKYIYFRAYITSFSDTYDGDWNSTKYIGRAENLYNYSGFNRNIGLSFTMAAHTKAELLPLYKKLNLLVGTTAPSYNNDQSFMRGVFTKLTIGDYLMQVPGFFTNVGISWNLNYPWEIRLNSDYSADDTSPKVPHLLDVNLSFTPVHDFNPEIERPFITNEQFIPFEKESVKGVGYVPLDDNQSEPGGSSPRFDKVDVPPITHPGKFKQAITNASNFIKKASKVNKGTPETVSTVDIDSEKTIIPLDDIKTNII